MVSNIQHSSILKNLWHFQSLICHSDTGSQNWHLICGSACACVCVCPCVFVCCMGRIPVLLPTEIELWTMRPAQLFSPSLPPVNPVLHQPVISHLRPPSALTLRANHTPTFQSRWRPVLQHLATEALEEALHDEQWLRYTRVHFTGLWNHASIHPPWWHPSLRCTCHLCAWTHLVIFTTGSTDVNELTAAQQVTQ